MPDTTPNAKGPAPVKLTPETTEPALIPADQVKPEDIGTLSIEYRDGQPVIVVSGGRCIPAGLPVVNASDNVIAAYAATRFINEGSHGASMHLHGSATVAPFDGWAMDMIKPGQYKDYYYPNFQPGR